MQIEFGNAGDVETSGTGWFIGFSDWCAAGAGLRHIPEQADARGLCVKWYAHPAGDPNGEAKPVSVGRSLSMLVAAPGEFKLEFAPSPAFAAHETVTHVLRRPGDFAAWGAGVYHRAYGLQRSTVLTLRWLPV